MTDFLALVEQLGRALDASAPDLERSELYFVGRQPLAFLAPEILAAVAGRLRPLVLNWPRLVVRALEERLDVDGFRLSPQGQADDRLWAIWQANNLDEQSQLAHEEALVSGRSYVLVWAHDDGSPSITVESARQVYVSRSPGTRRRTAAIKRWAEDGFGHAVVFTPDEVARLRTVGRVTDGELFEGVPSLPLFPASGWEVVDRRPNPLGVVPVVPLVNRARLLRPDGESELSDVIPLADAVNKLATDMLVASEYLTAPRRWATGIELPEVPDPLTGEPSGLVDAEPFNPLAGRTWLAEDPAAKFGQLPGADLGGFTNALRTLTSALAGISGLPPHYFGQSSDNPASADAIRSAESSLVKRAERCMRPFGGAWEEVMRLALTVETGRVDPAWSQMETVWRSPETRTVAQAADAAAKLAGIGVPLEALLPGLGYSPVEVERIRAMKRRETLDAAGVDLSALAP